MIINFPDEIAENLGLNKKEMLEFLVVALYKKKGIHGAMCGRILNISEMKFHGLLEKYDECVNYSSEDFLTDIENLKDV